MKNVGIIVVLFILNINSGFSSEAIGYYSDGKLKDAESIVDQKILIHKLFLQRQRFYGTQQMLDTINDAADYVRNTYPDSGLLQVGDLSNKTGGPCTGHGSHQNGLDSDIVYLTKNNKLQSQNASYWEENFVLNGVIDPNFDIPKNFALFKFLVTTQKVERIFVDQAIKIAFCAYAENNNLLNDSDTKETLRRLRVEDLHKTHFHMRLPCPKPDSACKSQTEVPPATGC